MPLEQTLRRAQLERQHGDVASALARVQGLVGTYPQRLDLRELLADLHRELANPVQAGRWSYLSEERRPEELRAFEAVASTPVERMRALSWRGPVEEAATETARSRLLALREDARDRTGNPQLDYPDLGRWQPAPRTPWLDALGIGCLLTVLALVLLGTVNGVVVVLRWLL